jgi:hypothetical protein
MTDGPIEECKAHGVPNLAMVRPNVYRSGQPTAEGWDYLRTLFTGRRVHVLKLNFESEGSDNGARIAGFDVRTLSIEPRTNPDGLAHAVAEIFQQPPADVWAEIMRQIRSIPKVAGNDIWLVHCVNGWDRTGLVCGHIRRIVDEWSKEAAFNEMLERGFHPAFVGLVRQWEDLA